MDNLVNALPLDELKAMALKYKDNPPLANMFNEAIKVKEAELEQVKIKDTFMASIAKVKLPTPPDGIMNIHFRYGDVEIEDKSKPAVKVEIVKVPAVTGADGAITTPAIMETVERFPTVKSKQWILELNKATSFSSSGTTSDNNTPSKRAITVLKRNGDKLDNIGNFKDGKAACDYVRLAVVGDSAIRVLSKNGYIVDRYDGTDLTA